MNIEQLVIIILNLGSEQFSNEFFSGGGAGRPPMITTKNEEDGTPMAPGTNGRKNSGAGHFEVKRGILYGLPVHLYGELTALLKLKKRGMV